MSQFFFFNDAATAEIYTLSLHDALPISVQRRERAVGGELAQRLARRVGRLPVHAVHRAHPLVPDRSEEHTSGLQSRQYLVCRLLLEKKTYVSTRLTRLSRLPASA